MFILLKQFKFINSNIKKSIRFISQKPVKILGEPKHFPPAVKEWPDSIYTYNINYLKQIINKKNTINNLIKSYFYLYNKNNVIKSKRIRKLINFKSLNRPFISKPEIKHSNDKITINLFSYNKSIKSNIKNIYLNNSNLSFYNMWLKNHFLTKGNDINNNVNNKSFVNNLYNLFNDKILNLKNYKSFQRLPLYFNNNKKKRINNISFLLRKKINSIKYNNKSIKKLQILPQSYKSSLLIRKKMKNKFSYYRTINEKNLLLLRSVNIKNKNIRYLQKLFIYYFLNCILQIFNIKINILLHRNKKDIIISFYNNKSLFVNPIIIKSVKSEYINYYVLDKINFITWNLLSNIFTNVKLNNMNSKLFFLFKYFYYKYYSNIYIKLLKNNILNNVKYSLFMVNTYKYGKFLYYLKNIIYNIYNKKVDINIVNLKYPQLNSDIITNIMTRNLKRKKGLYSRVLGKTTMLSKLPLKVFYKKEFNSINNLDNINYYRSLEIGNVKYKNIIDILLKKIYPIQLIDTNNNKIEYGKIKYTKNLGKTSNVLNSIKYKWITGIRLETAGRLTRRFTAARSIFKFKYVGSLRNIDFITKNGITKPISTVMLRNYIKANCQNTSENSKKRIGAFNIKTWISSY